MSLSRLWLAVGLALPACASDSSVESSADKSSGGTSDTKGASAAATSREAITSTIDQMVKDGRFKGEVWRLNLSERYGSDVHVNRAVVDGDLLIAQDDSKQIHAIEAASGIHRWIIQLPALVTQQVGGTASTLTFVSTDEVVAVDRRSGARHNGTSELPRPYDHLGFFPSGRGVTVRSTMFIGRLAPFGLQAIDLAGGHEGWSYATARPVLDVVVLGDGPTAQVILGTEDGVIASLPPRGAGESTWSPKENWFFRLPASHIVTPFALGGDSLVFGTDEGFLHHFDARTGHVRWKVGCGHDQRGHEALIAGGGVYQVSDGALHAFDLATGAELWTLPNSERAITRVGDHVYAQFGGAVVVLDAKTGKELSSFASSGWMVPTIRGGGLFIAGDGTNFFALD